MKKLLATLLLTTGIVNAQELSPYKLDVMCGSTHIFQKTIVKYEEELFWSRVQRSGIIVSLWYNSVTKSFTILQTSKTGETSCVIASGDPTH